jgi:predicted transposase YdaD
LQTFDAYNVFPEYFIISVPVFDDIIKQEIDEWLYVMKHEEVKEDFKSPYMKKVAERLSMLRMTPAERKVYNEYVNKSLKERDYLVSAEEKGREEGREEVAKNMLLRLKLDIGTVQKATELPRATLEKILQENK